jgi:hypothetical protein
MAKRPNLLPRPAKADLGLIEFSVGNIIARHRRILAGFPRRGIRRRASALAGRILAGQLGRSRLRHRRRGVIDCGGLMNDCGRLFGPLRSFGLLASVSVR